MIGGGGSDDQPWKFFAMQIIGKQNPSSFTGWQVMDIVLNLLTTKSGITQKPLAHLVTRQTKQNTRYKQVLYNKSARR